METIEKVRICSICAEDKKADNIVALELTGLTDIADYFVLADGSSERHVKTISDHIEAGMKNTGIKPYSVEGYDDGRWVIIDYGDVVVHIFVESLRDLYDLESLWIEAKRLRLVKRK